MSLKVRSTIDENGVTVWLPLMKWPVISVSIVDETARNLLWAVVHESFREAGTDDGGGTIELTITRLSATPHEAEGANVRTNQEIALHYGIAPRGMRQTVPHGATPPALHHGSRYLAVVRETVKDKLRWFEFSAGRPKRA
jgi:hypothetical protein